MAKTYLWDIPLENDEGTVVPHTVELVCSFVSGKAMITIDGDKYDISVKPFSLRGTNQMFRLGDLAAIVDFPKKGNPTITVDGELIQPK